MGEGGFCLALQLTSAQRGFVSCQMLADAELGHKPCPFFTLGLSPRLLTTQP